MGVKRELLRGISWRILVGLMFLLTSRSTVHLAIANETEETREIDISILVGDSIHIQIAKDGLAKNIVLSGDSIIQTPLGIKIDGRLIVEGGEFIADSLGISEEELQKLTISRDLESIYAIKAGRNMQKHIRRKRLVTVYMETGMNRVGFDGLLVDAGNIINGNVVSIAGDITILGEVHGDVVSAFGNIYIKDNARVYGDITAPFGKVYRDKNAQVKGHIAEHKKITRKKQNVNFDLSIRYDRVEGLALLPALKYEDINNRLPSMTIGGGYAFALKRWEYDFAVTHKFGRKLGPFFDLSFYQEAQTSDIWMLTEVENSIAGLLLKEDFHDFYWKRGFTGGPGIFWGNSWKAGFDYTGAKISNLKKNTDWAIFGGHKHFRQNWSTVLTPDSAAIDGIWGDLNEISIYTTYDTRDDKEKPTTGILGNVDWLQTTRKVQGHFNYRLVTAELKSYIPIAYNQTLMTRFRAGFSDDDLPLFRKFFIGGIGSLRGYDYKEFEGNRYLLANLDYIWQIYPSDLGAGVFFDLGKAGFTRSDFKHADLKTDVGICLLIEDFLRIDLAQRLDDIDKKPVISARGIILF